MKILEHIAQHITEKTYDILGYPISITDKEGYIIGSTDRNRLGIFHRPSLEVLKKNEMVTCNTEASNHVLPGISIPLMFNHEPIGVLGIVGEPAEVEKYIHLVKNQVEMMCKEAFRKETRELETKMIDVFVQQLIHFESDDKYDYISHYANILDYDLDINRACILIDINNLSIDKLHQRSNDPFSFSYFQRDVIDFLRLIFAESTNDILSSLSIERFIIIKEVKSHEAYSLLIHTLEQKLNNLNQFLESKFRCSAAIAVGDMNFGINGIASSYRNAKKVMMLGKETNQEPKTYIYNVHETTLQLLPKELTQDLHEKLLKIINPLIDQDNYETLANTLIAYCKYNLNLSEAARNMYIHRNTIIYRLEKIKELTSLNTNNFEHCLLLYIAIRHHLEGKKEKQRKEAANSYH